MALRVPWKKQEVALLIDSYIKVRDGKISRKEAVQDLSCQLRKRAIIIGLTIDDVFRNTNGISMQMTLVEHLMEEKNTGLCNSSKLFSQMVEIYKTDKNEFAKILIQGKGECGMMPSVKDAFFTWLASKIPAQFHPESEKLCKDIEEYCLNKNILKQPLFETTDITTIQKVKEAVFSSVGFKMKHFYNLGKMRKIISLYEKFVSEMQVTELEDDSNLAFHNENSTMKGVDGSAQTTADCLKGVCIEEASIDTTTLKWNFSSDQVPDNLKDVKPTGIIYFNEELSCSNWAEAYIKTIQVLQEDYPSIIRGMVGYRFPSIDQTAWCGQNHANCLSHPVEISDRLFLETEISPVAMFSIIRVVLEKCNVDFENVSLRYIYSPSSNEDSSKEDTIASDSRPQEDSSVDTCDNRKVEFRSWLLNTVGMATPSARSYSSAVHTAGQYAVKYGFSDVELFGMTECSRVISVCNQLFQHPEFSEINANQHNRFRSATTKYIDFCRKDMPVGGKTSHEEISTSTKEKTESEISRSQFKNWMETQHMQKAAILSYLSDIKKCSEFAKQQGYIESDFFEIADWQIIDSVLLAMKKDPKFIELNEQRYKRPTSALHKLILYRRSVTNIPETQSMSMSTSESTAHVDTVDDEIKQRYLSILEEYFEDGFRFGKVIDKNRFRIYYSEKYGQDLEDSDEQLVTTLMSIGSVRDERIFVNADSEQKDILSEIEKTIDTTFSSGASCIYFDCLFNHFQSTLVENLHIYSSEALETVILSQSQKGYFKRYGFLCCVDREPNPQDDVIQYMRSSLYPVSYNSIEKDVWFIPLDKIKQVLVNTPQIVNVAAETYFYAPNLPVSEVELQNVADLIHGALLQSCYISDVELTNLIEERLPSVIVNTSDYTMWGRRNALAYLLRDKFSFRGAIISNKGEELSMSEVFMDFCKRTSHLSLDELKAFANELQTVIYWDAVYSEMIRINQSEFIRKDQIQFDINKIDDLLDNLISGKYLPLKSMDNLFLHFPALTTKWNGYVLESFLVNYSHKFCLLHASFSATDCCGAIVRRNSGINDYRTLIVDVLAENSGWNNKTDALQLLVDDGYQQRRSYKDIENVMLEAKLLREQVTKKK